MIPIANITAIASGVAANIGLTFVRADQQGAHPAYPFFSYKVISVQEESAYQNIRVVEENSTDSSVADVKVYDKSEAVISFTFLDENRVDRIYPAAGNALNFLKSIEGKLLATNNEIAIQILSPSVEDRTVYQEAFFENKIGFDVRADYSGLYTQEVEGIETITIEIERDDIPQDDIIITE